MLKSMLVSGLLLAASPALSQTPFPYQPPPHALVGSPWVHAPAQRDWSKVDPQKFYTGVAQAMALFGVMGSALAQDDSAFKRGQPNLSLGPILAPPRGSAAAMPDTSLGCGFGNRTDGTCRWAADDAKRFGRMTGPAQTGNADQFRDMNGPAETGKFRGYVPPGVN